MYKPASLITNRSIASWRPNHEKKIYNCVFKFFKTIIRTK